MHRKKNIFPVVAVGLWKNYNQLCFTLHGMMKTLTKMQKSPFVSVHMAYKLNEAHYCLIKVVEGLKNAYTK